MNRGRGRPGFTMVEVLTVIAIIALLVGILLPALSGAKKRSLKTRELSDLRQIIHAWGAYANTNADSALPGWIDQPVQEAWNVKYEYPDGTSIPAQFTDITGPWTFRLWPFLSFSHELVHGYADEPEFEPLELSDPASQAEAYEIAQQPAFGYNGLYVGGWWEMARMGNGSVPRYRYYDAVADLDGDGTIGPDERARVVARTVSQIRRAGNLVVFCSSAQFPPDTTIDGVKHGQPGAHWVCPSFLEETVAWRIPVGGSGIRHTETVIETVTGCPVPIGRYTGNAAVAFADGHTDTMLPGAMTDQRFFIDIADKPDFQHR